MNRACLFANGDHAPILNFHIGHFPATCRNRHPVLDLIRTAFVMFADSDSRVAGIVDLCDGRVGKAISMASLATNLHRFMLFGINVSISHNIHLCVAIGAVHSFGCVHILYGLASSGK